MGECLFDRQTDRQRGRAVCVCRPRRAFSAERIEELKQLSRAPDIYDRLARALGEAPALPENTLTFTPLPLQPPVFMRMMT